MDSGNNSSSLQSSSGGGDEEFDSRAFFATNINASAATDNANSNGTFSISNNTPTVTTAATTNNNFNPFLDNFSFLVPASPFPLLDRRGPDNPAPAKTPPANALPSPRSTTSSKKRSRASRRAPTTVLTTDTSNFRAMVQEFTGIPSPPFASSSSSSASPYPPPHSRFDFFSPALFNAGGSGVGASPSFPLKPYPQKPFHFPNTNIATLTSATNSTINGSTSINYHHLPQPQPQPQPPSSSNFRLSNSQSLLQSQLAAKPQIMPPTSTVAVHHYGSVGDLGHLTGVIGSGWGQDAGVDPSSLLRQLSNGACKLNYSAAGAAAGEAEFTAEKGGGEPRGGEGMVESWICSSD